DNLGWMYFKVHNTKKGIEIVNEGLKKYPESSDLLMTLGTLYSDIWDYENSKKYYLDSINYSYNDFKSNSFRAICYYNIAILEHSFLFYENAFNSSNASVSLKDRSSAHMELNYLYQSRLELKKAYEECIKASGLEPKTLFPEMSIANINIYAGNVDKGINLILDLLRTKDFSWMLYFGTNKDAFYSELYKNLAFGYLCKSNSLEFMKKHDFFNLFIIPFERIYYYLLSVFYNFRFANLNIKIGEELIKGGSELEGLHQLYDGYKSVFSPQAYKLLLITEKIETKLNSRKQKIFNIEKPTMKNKVDLFYSNKQKKNDLLKAINLLDNQWEKALKVDALYEVYSASSGDEKSRYRDELFSLFPPILPMSHISMGFKIVLTNSGLNSNSQKKLLKALRNRGIINDKKSSYTLDIKTENDSIYVNLYDKKNIINSYNIKQKSKNKNDFEELTIEIFKKIFTIELSRIE
ncbi:MAG TPA: hypothetical protein PK771_14355, partial [Spirochaetota bacterium]|nr:hypothetical protein [Spirochaetota bacterium]